MLAVLVALSFLSTTVRARASDDATAYVAPRSTRTLSVEFNPLALVVDPIGGQLQGGIAGPISLVASVSHLALPNGQSYDG